MKLTILGPFSLAIFGLSYNAPALDQTAPATDATPPATTAPAKPAIIVHRPSAVAEVLQLVKAKVDDETIVAFVNNSGRVYNLSATEIIELKNQGVSDAVLTAMLQQSQRAIKTPEAATPPAYAVAPQAIPTNMPPGAVYAPPQDMAAGQPVYAYPDSSYYPDYYPYYPYYSYPYYYPGISFYFGYGGYYGRYCYPYYRGRYYGGRYYPYYRGGYSGYRGANHGGSAGYHGVAPGGGFHGSAGFAVSHGGGGHGGGGHR